MKVLLKVYDKSKYEADAKVIFKKEYNNVLNWEFLSGKQFRTDVYDELDENDEYLRIYFDNNTTQTFRNSHVDLFKMKKLTHEQLFYELVRYALNIPHPILEELREEHGNKIDSILADFEQEWNEMPFVVANMRDEEGATAEQEENMVAILVKYAYEILKTVCLIHKAML